MIAQAPKVLFITVISTLMLLSPLSFAQNVKKRTAQKKKPVAELPQAGKISALEVQGQKRLEKDAVLGKVSSQVGQQLDRDTVRTDILALFETGYFESVDVTFDKGVLRYIVQEKPVLAELTFEGNKELKAEELQEASGFKTFEIFNQGKLKESVDKMLKLYEDKGFYLVKIEPKITQAESADRVTLGFTITENEKVRVKTIHFIGNQKLSDDYLKGRLATQEEGYFAAISS